MKWGQFKPLLADAVVEHITPIQKRYAELMADQSYLKGVLNEGAEAADEVASQTLDWAKTAMGVTSRKDLILP